MDERGPEPGAAKLLSVLPRRGCCGEPPSFSCLSTGAAFLAARLHAARQQGDEVAPASPGPSAP